MDQVIAATYVTRGEASSILQCAAWLSAGKLMPSEDSLSGCHIATGNNEALNVLRVEISKPVVDAQGVLDAEQTLLMCQDASKQQVTIPASSLTELLPPDGAQDSPGHISKTAWRAALQQLQASPAAVLYSKYRVATVMLKLWRYTALHEQLLAIQQLLTKHNVSMAAMGHLLATAVEAGISDDTRQQQQHSEAGSLQQWYTATVDLAALQCFKHNVAGVTRARMKELWQLLVEAARQLDLTAAPGMLKDMLSFLPDIESAPSTAGQHQHAGQTHQVPEQQGSQQGNQSKQQKQQDVQIKPSVVLSSPVDVPDGRQQQQQATGLLQKLCNKQLHSPQQLVQPPTLHTTAVQHVAAPESVLQQQQQGTKRAADQELMPEQCKRPAPAAAATHDTHGISSGGGNSTMGTSGGGNSTMGTSAPGAPSGADATAAAAHADMDAGRIGVIAGDIAADASDGETAGGGPAAAAAAAPPKSKHHAMEAYAVALYDDLTFSLDMLSKNPDQSPLLHTKQGWLIQLDWYMNKINEGMKERLKDEAGALKYLENFAAVFRIEKRPPAQGSGSSAPEVFIGLQPDAKQALLSSDWCQKLLAEYKARLREYVLQHGSPGSSVELELAEHPACGLFDKRLTCYSKIFGSFADFAKAALADEFDIVVNKAGKAALALRQPVTTPPLAVAQVAPASGNDISAAPTTVTSSKSAAATTAGSGSGRKHSASAASQLSGVGIAARLSVQVDNLQRADEKPAKQQLLQRSVSPSVWERLGGGFGKGPTPAAAAMKHPAAVGQDSGELPQPLLHRLTQTVDAEVGQSLQAAAAATPAAAADLNWPQQPPPPPPRRGKQQDIPQLQKHEQGQSITLPLEVCELLDLAVVEAFSHLKQQLQLEAGEMSPSPALHDRMLRKHTEVTFFGPFIRLLQSALQRADQKLWRKAVLEGQLGSTLLEYLQLLKEQGACTGGDRTEGSWSDVVAAAAAADLTVADEYYDSTAPGMRPCLWLEVPAMRARLLKHQRLRGAARQQAQAVLLAAMRRGADQPNRLHVPRLLLEAATELLHREVPALRPYLLVPNFLEEWIHKSSLQATFAVLDGIQWAGLPTKPRRFVEVKPKAAHALGLQLRACTRAAQSGTCRFSDQCFYSHVVG